MKGGRGEITIEEIVGTYSGCCQELKTWLSSKNGVLEVFWSGRVREEEQAVLPTICHLAWLMRAVHETQSDSQKVT